MNIGLAPTLPSPACGGALGRRAYGLRARLAARPFRDRRVGAREPEGHRQGEFLEIAAGDRRPARRQGLRARLAILGGGRLYASVLRLGQAHRTAGRAVEELHRAEGPAAAAPGGQESARTRAERLVAELIFYRS